MSVVLEYAFRSGGLVLADALVDAGVEFRLERLYDTDELAVPGDGLTDEQRGTLELAYDRGYFSLPREATTVDLAEGLAVSDQAVNERLRRGYACPVRTRLAEKGE